MTRMLPCSTMSITGTRDRCHHKEQAYIVHLRLLMLPMMKAARMTLCSHLKFGFYVLSALLQNAQHLQPFLFGHDAHSGGHHGCLLGCLLVSMLLRQAHLDVLQVSGHLPVLLLLQPPVGTKFSVRGQGSGGSQQPSCSMWLVKSA